jgi:hypothetical protein
MFKTVRNGGYQFVTRSLIWRSGAEFAPDLSPHRFTGSILAAFLGADFEQLQAAGAACGVGDAGRSERDVAQLRGEAGACREAFDGGGPTRR